MLLLLTKNVIQAMIILNKAFSCNVFLYKWFFFINSCNNNKKVCNNNKYAKVPLVLKNQKWNINQPTCPVYFGHADWFVFHFYIPFFSGLFPFLEIKKYFQVITFEAHTFSFEINFFVNRNIYIFWVNFKFIIFLLIYSIRKRSLFSVGFRFWRYFV